MHKDRDILSCISIGSHWLKFIQVESPKTYKKILSLFAKDITSVSDDDIAKIIEGSIKSIRNKPTKLSISIPRHLTSVRFLTLPSTKDEEIKKMVDFQTIKQLPYYKEEIITDYHVIDKTKDGFSLLILAIIHKNIIHRYLDIFKKINIDIVSMGLSSQDTLRWARSSLYTKKILEDTAINGVLEVDQATTDVIVFSGNKLLFTRAITIGMSQLQEEQAISKFIEEIRRTFVTFEKEHKLNNPAKIILTGATNLKDLNLDKKITSELSIPTEFIDCLNTAKNLTKSNFPEDISPCNIIGGCITDDMPKINLVPKDIQEGRLLIAKKHEILTLGSLILILILSLSIFIFKKFNDKNIVLTSLEERLKDSSPKAEKLETMFSTIKLVRSRLSGNYSAIDIISELYKITPEAIKIAVFDYEYDKKVTIKGASKNMSEAFEYVKILEDSPIFENVKLDYVSEKKDTGKKGADFQLICPLSTAK